jgi:hypothetical protein
MKIAKLPNLSVLVSSEERTYSALSEYWKVSLTQKTACFMNGWRRYHRFLIIKAVLSFTIQNKLRSGIAICNAEVGFKNLRRRGWRGSTGTWRTTLARLGRVILT